jgi:hypothetical protein
MRKLLKTVCGVMLTAAVLAPAAGLCQDAKPEPQQGPRVQIAVLLDTSNSMDGLIVQAKTQLWKIVNEFAIAKVDGKSPNVEVALYEYGNDGLPEEGGHMRLVVPLTGDLDKVSLELFALKTNGGDEFCGQVIGVAVKNLSWSASNDDLKVIFIAGNEPFTQGSVDYKVTCKDAITKGVVVNTIFCGSKQEGEGSGWKDGAMLADGSFMNIDQNQIAAEPAAPQDQELAKLSQELNKTYVGYGADRKEKEDLQKDMDDKAEEAGTSVAAGRAQSKAAGKKLYDCSAWDLIDALAKDPDIFSKVKDEELPEEMRKMTVDEKKAFVAGKAKERTEMQAKIKELSEARKIFIAEEMKKQAGSGDTLDSAMIKALRSQAAKKGFKFEDGTEKPAEK